MIVVAGLSDIGCKRSANEDRILMDLDELLFAIADGMGGARCGGQAADIAISTLREYFRSTPNHQRKAITDIDLNFALTQGHMVEAIQVANERIFRLSGSSHECEGMGCTLSAVFVSGTTATVGHVGDTRVYLYRQDQLYQLTRDDSVVAKLIATGEIGAEEASSHPMRNMLMRSIGTSEEVDIQLIELSLQARDRLLLSSDGLHGVIGETSLREILGAAQTPEITAQNLIQAALDRGAPDNTSCIILDCE